MGNACVCTEYGMDPTILQHQQHVNHHRTTAAAAGRRENHAVDEDEDDYFDVRSNSTASWSSRNLQGLGPSAPHVSTPTTNHHGAPTSQRPPIVIRAFHDDRYPRREPPVSLPTTRTPPHTTVASTPPKAPDAANCLNDSNSNVAGAPILEVSNTTSNGTALNADTSFTMTVGDGDGTRRPSATTAVPPRLLQPSSPRQRTIHQVSGGLANREDTAHGDQQDEREVYPQAPAGSRAKVLHEVHARSEVVRMEMF